MREVYAQLSPWQKMQVARHPQRPHCLDFVKGLIDDFTPLAGDRKFGEDEAVVCGLGRFRGEPICLIGQEKGFDDRGAPQAQFRHGAPRGLSQGGAPDGARRPLRASGHRLHRYGRRLSRDRRRGARPGRGDRALDRCVPRARRAEYRPGHRGRRLGRRRGARDRQSHLDARACHLQRHLSRGRGLDFVARQRARPGGGLEHANHGAGSDAGSASSTPSCRSRSAGRIATPRPPSRPPARLSPQISRNCATSTLPRCAPSGPTSSWRLDDGSEAG